MRTDMAFNAYLIGKKESIEAFNKAASLKYDANYFPTWDFIRGLNLKHELNEYSTSSFNLEEYRKMAEDEGNEEAISKLKDENLKKSDYLNIPKDKHFFGISSFKPDQVLEEVSDGVYFSKGTGTLWKSLEDCFGTTRFGYYANEIVKVPKKFFNGLCLREFARMYPDLKIAIVAFDIVDDYTSFVYLSNGGLRIFESGMTSRRGILYDTVPDWFSYKYFGEEDLDEDELSFEERLALYSDPVYNENFVLNKLGLNLKKEDM